MNAMDVASMTALASTALEQNGYEMRILKESSGYIEAHKYIGRLKGLTTHRMYVSVQQQPGGGFVLKTQCMGETCISCKEEEEMQRFYDTFGQLLGARRPLDLEEQTKPARPTSEGYLPADDMFEKYP